MADLEEVKRQASGRWRFIIGSRAPHLAEMIARGPRRNGPCPLCGGRDRARIFGDFDETGGIFCNQCGQRVANGFSTLMWANGWDFKTTLAEVAAYLGLGDAVGGAKIRPPLPPPIEKAKRCKASIEAQNRARVEAVQREVSTVSTTKGKI